MDAVASPRAPTYHPNRILPLVFLVAFGAGFALDYAIPWLTSGGPGRPTTNTWAGGMSDTTRFLGDSASNPANLVLTGLIIGAGVSLLWLVLSVAVPPRHITPLREAGVASLLAIPLYFVVLGGASGLGLGFSLNSFAGSDGFSLSVAGIVITAVGLAGVAALGLFLVQRMPRRRMALLVMIGGLLAVAAFHLLPWATLKPARDGATSMNIWRAVVTVAGTNGDDPLALAGAALLLLVAGSTAWMICIAFVPEHPRWDALVEGSFGILLLVPLLLAAIGVGRFFGLGMGGLFTGGPGYAFSIASWVFALVIAALTYAMVATTRASYAALGASE